MRPVTFNEISWESTKKLATIFRVAVEIEMEMAVLKDMSWYEWINSVNILIIYIINVRIITQYSINIRSDNFTYTYH